MAAVDSVTGVALPGSPALVPWLNQGTAVFTGSTATSSQVLTVSSMNSTSITSASYSSTTGYVTFTTSAATGYIPGSEFTVSGMSVSGFNQTYVALSGTTQAGTFQLSAIPFLARSARRWPTILVHLPLRADRWFPSSCPAWWF